MSVAPRTLVVVAPNWLGDAVMALPAIADARRHWPDARLIVAARAAVADLFGMVPGIDDVVVLRRERRGDADRLRALGADAGLLLPNSFGSAWLLRQAGIAERWGYAADWRSPLLTRAIARPRRSVHQAAYYQMLTTALGVPPGPLEPALAVPQASLDSARALLTVHGWEGQGPLVVMAPGAAYGTAKRWIPAHVAALASELIERRGATCAFVGSRADLATTTVVTAAMTEHARSRAIDLAGETTLQQLAGVLALADTCVANDSGAMHMAAALGTPVVAVFGPTREYETAPLPRQGGRADVLTHPVWCRPCMLRECPIDHRCMTRVTPARVFLSVETMLTGSTR